MSEATKYPTLPHDEWYDDETWEFVLHGDGFLGPAAGQTASKFDSSQVDDVELWHVDEGCYGPEHNAAGLFRMKDGSYVVYTGWCDTTGWDCQSDARFTFHDSREHAVRFGLGDEERGWFGVSL